MTDTCASLSVAVLCIPRFAPHQRIHTHTPPARLALVEQQPFFKDDAEEHDDGSGGGNFFGYGDSSSSAQGQQAPFGGMYNQMMPPGQGSPGHPLVQRQGQGGMQPGGGKFPPPQRGVPGMGIRMSMPSDRCVSTFHPSFFLLLQGVVVRVDIWCVQTNQHLPPPLSLAP